MMFAPFRTGLQHHRLRRFYRFHFASFGSSIHSKLRLEKMAFHRPVFLAVWTLSRSAEDFSAGSISLFECDSAGQALV
jgi:hypothetical protein